MPKRKLIITYNIDQAYRQEINDIIPDWEIIAGKKRSVWLNHLKEAEIIVGWKKEITHHCIDKESNLRWVQSWSSGVNGLPLDEMAAQKIFLTNASGVHAYPISETIFALMLALTRNIHTYVRNQLSKTWNHGNLKLEIHGKTVGIIGVGAIGKETAKIAKAFGMKVIGLRRSGNPEEYIDEMYKPEQLNTILPLCDYVVITLPLTKETYHLFGTQQFNLMKSSSFLINIGRGEIVAEEELMKALNEQQIAGAGLDVFEKEPLSKDSPWWNLENVIITPHTAGSTEYYDKRIIQDIFIPNLKHYIQGAEPVINLVDYVKGY
ncbi:D-2-hydroxyacid dehydrogenase [Bacillus songklensis]|uniref:D-2-hydroxyacid dehydrogenase n=1 Tax=Bacillus songklensis TaxID=1069116 RepID=A0ABV8B303_9BACI